MAQLVGFIVSQDDAFKTQIGRLLRSGAIPVSVIDDRLASDNAAMIVTAGLPIIIRQPYSRSCQTFFMSSS